MYIKLKYITEQIFLAVFKNMVRYG